MGERRGMKALELWCRKIVGGYRDVQLDNMTSSFRDGLAFCAIIHHFRPDLLDFDLLSKENIFYNNNLAFSVAEQHLGIPALLDAEDMVTYKVPDKLSIMTYLSQLYKYFHGMEESPNKSPSKRPLNGNVESITASLTEAAGNLPTSTLTPFSALSTSPSPSPSPRAQRRSFACHACNNRIYILERLIVDNKLYHRMCFKCHKCRTVLHPGSYVESKESSETYECVQCPLDEDRCDRSRHATTAALRSFREKKQFTVQSARGSVISKPVKLPQSISSLIADEDETNGRSGFSEVNEDPPASFDDTGQAVIEDTPPPLTSSAANVILNDEPVEIIVPEVGEVPAEGNDFSNTMDDPNKIVNIVNVDEDDVRVRRKSESFVDVIERKSVSDMIKMFASNKERCEMQRVAIVRPQMPLDVELSPDETITISETTLKVKTELEEDELLSEPNIAPCPAPRRAPRTHRKKCDIPEMDGPVNVSPPVPKQRTQIKCDIVDGSLLEQLKQLTPTSSPPPPPKPPRCSIVEAPTVSVTPDYPEDLNPFGEDDNLDQLKEKNEKSLNPFGSSDDEEETVPVKSNSNPFGSDSDSDDDEVIHSRTPPLPASRPSVVKILASPQQSPLPLRRSTGDTKTLGRKKRLAPLPPGHSPTRSLSATSSPFITPSPSPRTMKRMSVEPPPRPPPPISPISLDMCDIKSLKEIDNMNITKASSESQSPSKTSNTIGERNQRKKPAPGVPMPRRRQIQKIPLAEIQVELFQIETNQLELEKQGVQIEVIIREKFSDDIEPSIEEENLIMQLFELVNKKNALFRRQAELIYLKRQQRLEEEHADLEFQIRCLMEKPASKKSDEDRELEDRLIARLVDVVHQRSEIIESMEMDRLREAEEDHSIQERMTLKKNQLHRGSLSSQGSLGSAHGSNVSVSSCKIEKSKTHKKDKKDKKKKKDTDKFEQDGSSSIMMKLNDEDKDLDDSESSIAAKKTKEKKRKWFL